VALIFVLFVLPKILQRYRLPAALTSLFLGAMCGMLFGWFVQDETVHLLSTLGIVSLFLFAGLEADPDDLRREAPFLVQHLLLRAAMLAGGTWLLVRVFQFELPVAALVALAILTPSAGFILDSLHLLGANEPERAWIKSKAVAAEVLALAVLVVVLQSTDPWRLGLSIAAITGLIILLPLVFRLFAAAVVPHAPRSEFAFLLMVAVVCAFATRAMGVYYLVGAFVVGMAAQRFRERLPSMASEEMMRAVELFASFFTPFYFFSAGLHLRLRDFIPEALLVGAVLLALVVPVRIAITVLHRHLALREDARGSLRIAVPMLPTLVFGLVVAEILRDRFAVPAPLFGGIMIYTIGTTLIPALLMRQPLPDFETPHAPALPGAKGFGAPPALHSPPEPSR
jgi:Kef-type K+ transport system membrane component KefB